jgi:hypothetical protein
MKTKQMRTALRASIITLTMLFTSVIYSQDKDVSANSGEFDGVVIVKPENGFLKVTNNWKLVKRDIFDDKYYLPFSIFDEKGKHYLNVSGSSLGPQTVTLPEGLYYVKTTDAKNNTVKYGVEIIAGKFTLIE